jgi:hypothetical protein
MLKVLFVCEMWAECNPEHGPSNAHHNFIGSFMATSLGAVETFFFDEHVRCTGTRCDAALLQTVCVTCPDLVFVSPVRGSDLNPLPATLAAIRANSQAKVVTLHGDTHDDAGVAFAEEFAPAVDRIIVQDSYSRYPLRANDPGKYIAAWTPQDPRIFFRDNGPRPVDVSFLGSVARYPDRKRALGMLEAAGIDVDCGGGQSEMVLTIEDYATALRRAKLVINFAHPVFEAPTFQCKGRTVEATLSGALLLEQANPETEHWLTPGRHFVAFADERDLVDKTRHYLAHEDERAAIAEAGHLHAAAHLSADAYWRRLFEEVLPTVAAAW